METWVVAAWAAGSGVVAAAVSGFSTWAVARTSRAPADRTAEAALQASMTQGFATLAKSYEDRIQGLATQLSTVEGLVRDLSEHVVNLEDALSKRGMPIPPRTFTHPLYLVKKDG